MKHIPIILTQHAEDAAVLWERRKRAVNAPHYNAMYLGRLDEQLEAHVDGLRVAGSAGWEEAVDAFEDIGSGGEAFTLSTLAFGHHDGSLIPALLDHIKTDPSLLVGPATSGIGWLRRSVLHGKVDPLLNDDDPVARAIGVGACAVHRVDPGKRLARFLSDTPGVRRRAIRLAGEIGRVDLLLQLQDLCGDDDHDTAFWAAWSAVLLGDRGKALNQLLGYIKPSEHWADEAMRVALPAMGCEAGRDWLETQQTTAANIKMKMTGYGILGDAGAVPWLIEQMSETSLAQVAGESYAMITGADLEEEDLDGDMPDDASEGPNDDPEDDDVVLDENESLPWASGSLIAAHWQRIGSKFNANGWFLGQPANQAAYNHGLTHGYQRQRRLAAFCLAIADPETTLKNWQRPMTRY